MSSISFSVSATALVVCLSSMVRFFCFLAACSIERAAARMSAFPAAFLRQLFPGFTGLLGFGVERDVPAGFRFGLHLLKVPSPSRYSPFSAYTIIISCYLTIHGWACPPFLIFATRLVLDGTPRTSGTCRCFTMFLLPAGIGHIGGELHAQFVRPAPVSEDGAPHLRITGDLLGRTVQFELRKLRECGALHALRLTAVRQIGVPDAGQIFGSNRFRCGLRRSRCCPQRCSGNARSNPSGFSEASSFVTENE